MFHFYTNNEIVPIYLTFIFAILKKIAPSYELFFRRIIMGLLSKLIKQKSKKNKPQTKMEKLQELSGTAKDIPTEQIQPNLEQNISYLKQVTGNSSDITYREIEIGKSSPIKAAVVATEGLVDSKTINEFILNTIMLQPLENINQSQNNQGNNNQTQNNQQNNSDQKFNSKSNNNQEGSNEQSENEAQNSNNQTNQGSNKNQQSNDNNQTSNNSQASTNEQNNSNTNNNQQSSQQQQNNDDQNSPTNTPGVQIFNNIEKSLLPLTSVKPVQNWSDLLKGLMSGEAILFIDGANKALKIDVRGGEKRSITEPQTEVSIFGPKDSFTESIVTNTALIRKRIHNPNLWLESFTIGKVSQTTVQIMYINGIANDKIVNEVRNRIKRINTDQILDPSFIRQFIEDKTFTLFPTVYYTERPDRVTANIMEGRIAIFVDGSPFALTVPALFVEFFQSVDDYYSRFDISFFLRLLRVATFFIAMVLPSAYVAITTFHQEMAPTLFIIAIAAQREAVPFPAYFEALLMEITFEILREAGIRLPRSIGQAVSIVGALVIGQAAIQANIVSPAMVIIVSFTAIANFSIPSFEMAVSTRIIRFFLMTLAAVMGIYGVICGLMFTTIHLNTLRSFGVPYMSPLAPLAVQNMGDTFIRLPFWINKVRPKFISQKNFEQIGPNQQPHPPKQDS